MPVCGEEAREARLAVVPVLLFSRFHIGSDDGVRTGLRR